MLIDAQSDGVHCIIVLHDVHVIESIFLRKHTSVFVYHDLFMPCFFHIMLQMFLTFFIINLCMVMYIESTHIKYIIICSGLLTNLTYMNLGNICLGLFWEISLKFVFIIHCKFKMQCFIICNENLKESASWWSNWYMCTITIRDSDPVLT